MTIANRLYLFHSHSYAIDSRYASGLEQQQTQHNRHQTIAVAVTVAVVVPVVAVVVVVKFSYALFTWLSSV